MSEKFKESRIESEGAFDPMYYMRTLAEKLMKEHGGDEKKAMSLVADVLYDKGVDGAVTLHRFQPQRQQEELLGILDDPTSEEEIGLLFDWDAIPDTLKEHYELK